MIKQPKEHTERDYDYVNRSLNTINHILESKNYEEAILFREMHEKIISGMERKYGIDKPKFVPIVDRLRNLKNAISI